MILKDYFADLAWRHMDIGHTKSHEHFCDIGDESQVHADTVLEYPCVLYGEDAEEEFIGYADNVRRPYRIVLLFLDHVLDTSDFRLIEETKNHMDKIAEDFIRKFWEDNSHMVSNPNFSITYMENKDAALYGAMLTFTAEVPFCLHEANSPFLPGSIFDTSFDKTFN